ncbi:hypothetical protein J437_LFUL007364 [Ladona fulva]|uniref:Uncharacterized protein n=1 Tax=Ladona fulva TaxID=123851 RepID=A0A8K0K2K5_LADFU|nr:hypothetical protein J437_LFUL007364 [Ladona fulva]
MSFEEGLLEDLKNQKKLYGDFTPFYVVITICTVIGFALFLLNIIFCCCSRYKEYWQNSDTGNRWIVSIWTKTPTKQPALDYSELENCNITVDHPTVVPRPLSSDEYLELERRRECEV